MFVGRNSEIEKLNKMYSQAKFQCVIIYGRRRVGKTYLISEFIKDKQNIYFAAEEYNNKILLEKFSSAILKKFPSPYINSFDSFEKAMLYISEIAKDMQLVLAIDEFQYWVTQNKGITSTLQNLIDHVINKTKLFLILCGSYISFMEKEILGYESPLYGRRTAQFKIEPFDFFEACQFFPEYSIEDKIIAYSVLGGIPQYLNYFDSKKPIKENILENILDKNSFLHHEPHFLLKQELKEPAVYFSVIEAVAKGASKYNEISTKIGTDCGFYLNSLIELDILEKVIPIGEKKSSRKSIYRLKDNLFRFWFKFLSDSASLIVQELYEYIYENIILPEISQYVGVVFEEVCIQYLKRINGKDMLPFIFYDIGKWWGSNRIKKCEEEIDIVAVDYNNRNVLIGECKWRNHQMDVVTVIELIEKSSLLPYENKSFVFFSKSGYSDEVKRMSKHYPNITLINLEDMVKIT